MKHSDLLTGVLNDLDRREGDALKLFRPMATQMPALTTGASEILIRGGNRSGKSILGAAMLAAVVRGKPLIGLDGQPFFLRETGRPQLAWVVGWGEDHIGSTLYRLLFKPGQFPVIKDKKTGRLRAALNWKEKMAGEKQGLIAPPLIPENEIESFVFNRKGADYFDVCKLKNGSRIETYVSSGNVKMGDPVDWIWVDEDIEYPRYVNEWLARLSDRKGKYIWTAWPWSDNWALVRMSKRAEAQQQRKSPDVIELKLSFADNPFIDDDEKRKRYEAWGASGDDELKSRVDGEFQIGRSMMYPNFSLTVHGAPREGSAEPDKLTETLKANQFEPPQTWTRYLAFDPGHSYSAILFAAVPPTEDFGDVVVIYDELYLQCHDAPAVADRVRPKLSGVVFQDFIIDFRYARQTVPALGVSNLELYTKIWIEKGFKSVRSGSSFTFASDNVEAGIEAVRQWLTVRGDGTTRLRVIGSKVPNLLTEIQMYSKYFLKDEAQDKPAGGQRDHLVDCLRYLAMHGCPYMPPPDATAYTPPCPVYLGFQQHKAGQPRRPGSQFATFHCGAGAVSLGAR